MFVRENVKLNWNPKKKGLKIFFHCLHYLHVPFQFFSLPIFFFNPPYKYISSEYRVEDFLYVPPWTEKMKWIEKKSERNCFRTTSKFSFDFSFQFLDWKSIFLNFLLFFAICTCGIKNVREVDKKNRQLHSIERVEDDRNKKLYFIYFLSLVSLQYYPQLNAYWGS